MRSALIWTFLLLGCGTPAVDRGVQEGELAVDLRGTTARGLDWNLEDHLGKPAVLVFWASWCGPCMEEIPHLNALVESYGDRVEVIGINMGEEESTVLETQSRQAMKYPSVLDEDKRVANAWRVRRLPLLLVLDAESRIRLRGSASEQELKVLLDSLVRI